MIKEKDLVIENPFIEANKYIISVQGFVYKNKFITVHHNLPILKEENANLDIYCVWNELLFFNNYEPISVNYQIQSKLPPINCELTFYNYKLKYICNQYLSVDKLNSLMIPYIIAEIDDNVSLENMVGKSGSPVFYNNKIIGVFSKFDIINKYLKIIPAYFIKKSLEKKDNTTIYTIKNIDTIKKYNRFNVQDNQIFHHIFGNIPLQTYIMIEGDIGKNLIPYNDFLYIMDTKLIKKDKKKNIYIVTAQLLLFLRRFNFIKIHNEIVLKSKKYYQFLD